MKCRPALQGQKYWLNGKLQKQAVFEGFMMYDF